MKFNFEVVYVPGKQLVVTNTLSRQPRDMPGDTNELSDAVDEYVYGVRATWPAPDKGLERLRKGTAKDSELTDILALLETDCPDSSRKLRPAVLLANKAPAIA